MINRVVSIREIKRRLENKYIRINRATCEIHEYQYTDNCYLFACKYHAGELNKVIAEQYADLVLLPGERLASTYK